ncbi:MAG TPA: PAS domain-containing protein, partial [Candidatus Thermoplasmatota archaeon]|nr:PAS domain-containing protein [Candidatus Thermoplasmatota archaeon]
MFRTLREFLPEGRALPQRDWEIRHKGILYLIAAHVIGLAIFGLVKGWSPAYALGESALIGLVGLAAWWPRMGRRFRSGAAALALVTSSAVFTQFWGGYIEGHFHFFIVVAVVTLYQDYVPFLLSVAYVAIDHGVVGTLAPQWVYNHPAALAQPWTWAGYHALLVLGECAVLLYVWGMSERTRSQVDLLMNAAGEGILGLDSRGRVAFANPAAATLTGRPLAGLLGVPVEELVRDAKDPQSVLVMGAPTGYESGDDRLLVRADGTHVPILWARSPVREHGQTVGSVMTLVDATPQKQAEEERRK